MEIKLGGQRECIIIGRIVQKRKLRLIEGSDFLVLDDYEKDGIDQNENESCAFDYIFKNAPSEIKKFFPTSYGLRAVDFQKFAYSDTKLQDMYGYIAGKDTTLEILKGFPKARINKEIVLEVERVLAFEDFPLSYKKKFYGKEMDFKEFALAHGAAKEELKTLENWLKENISKNYWDKLDYEFVHSNWGLHFKTNHPLILDLGYFIFKN